MPDTNFSYETLLNTRFSHPNFGGKVIRCCGDGVVDEKETRPAAGRKFGMGNGCYASYRHSMVGQSAAFYGNSLLKTLCFLSQTGVKIAFPVFSRTNL